MARGLGVSARLFNRKDRQQAVTDEFQDLAAVVVNGLGLRVEEGVEQRDHAIARKPRSERAVKPRRSENHSTALISSPVPRWIWPLQHLWTRLGTQIRIEHIAGDGFLTVHID
jgi:hypothetical protein